MGTLGLCDFTAKGTFTFTTKGAGAQLYEARVHFTLADTIPGHYDCKLCTLTVPMEDAGWQLEGGLVHSSGLMGFPHPHSH